MCRTPFVLLAFVLCAVFALLPGVATAAAAAGATEKRVFSQLANTPLLDFLFSPGGTLTVEITDIELAYPGAPTGRIDLALVVVPADEPFYAKSCLHRARTLLHTKMVVQEFSQLYQWDSVRVHVPFTVAGRYYVYVSNCTPNTQISFVIREKTAFNIINWAPSHLPANLSHMPPVSLTLGVLYAVLFGSWIGYLLRFVPSWGRVHAAITLIAGCKAVSLIVDAIALMYRDRNLPHDGLRITVKVLDIAMYVSVVALSAYGLACARAYLPKDMWLLLLALFVSVVSLSTAHAIYPREDAFAATWSSLCTAATLTVCVVAVLPLWQLKTSRREAVLLPSSDDAAQSGNALQADFPDDLADAPGDANGSAAAGVGGSPVPAGASINALGNGAQAHAHLQQQQQQQRAAGGPLRRFSESISSSAAAVGLGGAGGSSAQAPVGAVEFYTPLFVIFIVYFTVVRLIPLAAGTDLSSAPGFASLIGVEAAALGCLLWLMTFTEKTASRGFGSVITASTPEDGNDSGSGSGNGVGGAILNGIDEDDDITGRNTSIRASNRGVASAVDNDADGGQDVENAVAATAFRSGARGTVRSTAGNDTPSNSNSITNKTTEGSRAKTGKATAPGSAKASASASASANASGSGNGRGSGSPSGDDTNSTAAVVAGAGSQAPSRVNTSTNTATNAASNDSTAMATDATLGRRSSVAQYGSDNDDDDDEDEDDISTRANGKSARKQRDLKLASKLLSSNNRS